MKSHSITKYQAFKGVSLPGREWPDKTITHAPIWASVDLRDGNQSLPVPMNIEEKLEYFDLLVGIGFKQIEVGFPSASDTEFNFLRRLVEEYRIPKDVTVQVLVQAREHLIRKTFDSLQGTKSAIVHLYNSTSPLQRKVTFSDASREKIKQIAIDGAVLIKELTPSLTGTDVTLQYSPESFSDTESDYAIEICEAVMDIWQPTLDNKIILNLPATVEWSTPNVHADQIEHFCKNLKGRENAIISLHTHNDRGTGTAATELGLLAGADRVEGTLFGNGERTGNLDIITVALNMNSHGIDTGLDFSNISEIRHVYERVTKLIVPERQPYAGELVFTAFSGSHQDAIKKGIDRRSKDLETDPETKFGIPYLTIDPMDIGRSYEAIIRINSQSGKGGIAYILQNEFGLHLPKTMHPSVGAKIYGIADEQSRELEANEIKEAFYSSFVNTKSPMTLIDYELDHSAGDRGDVACNATIEFNGEEQEISGLGNGPINALTHALEGAGFKNFCLTDYRSHAITGGSDSDSAAYIQLQSTDSQTLIWGCGIDSSIEMAGLYALVSAWNALHEANLEQS